MSKLKNGLTTAQVEKAKELFSKVNISALCRKNGVKYATIYNVLRDTNNNIYEFDMIVKAAQEQINKNQKALETLPL